MNKPRMLMLIGLPASGKSTFAKKMSETAGYVWHSSDAIREELHLDPMNPADNEKVFLELHRRIKRDLKEGRDVIYDATNLVRKRRMAFIKELDGICCKISCAMMLETVEECMERNRKRKDRVPDSTYGKFLKSFDPPIYFEGFHDITVYYFDDPQPIDLSLAEGFDQKNSHHTMTLSEHMRKAYEYVLQKDPENDLVLEAAKYHDFGKLFTQTFMDRKGNETNEAHYYGHEHYGSYLYLLHAISQGMNQERALYIAGLIDLHMRPLNAWKSSFKAELKDREMIGEKMFSDLRLLNEADLSAH